MEGTNITKENKDSTVTEGITQENMNTYIEEFLFEKV
jgi:hypothetical protein